MAGKVALITGITGQDGSYLTELLLEKNYIVHGVVRPGSGLKNIEHLAQDDKIFGRQLFPHESDITDCSTLRRIVRDVEPAELYHLAGQSHIGRSFEISESTYEQTGNATLQLLEITRAQSPRTRFFHASSAEIFGNAGEVPLTESTPLQPITLRGRARA
jgi:GDPmannose 4,6-dehydratase